MHNLSCLSWTGPERYSPSSRVTVANCMYCACPLHYDTMLLPCVPIGAMFLSSVLDTLLQLQRCCNTSPPLWDAFTCVKRR